MIGCIGYDSEGISHWALQISWFGLQGFYFPIIIQETSNDNLVSEI